MDNLELLILRKQAGLRQYELKNLLGISPVLQSQLETGRRTITPKMESEVRRVIKKEKVERIRDKPLAHRR